MTPAEIDALQAGRETDALVAERVMGCDVVQSSCVLGDMCGCTKNVHAEWEGSPKKPIIKGYSQDIAAAWEVMRWIYDAYDFLIQPYADGWEVVIIGPKQVDWIGQGETAPLAICRAALKAVGYE